MAVTVKLPKTSTIRAGETLPLQAKLSGRGDFVATWDAGGVGEFRPVPGQAIEVVKHSGTELAIAVSDTSKPLEILWDTTGVPLGPHLVTVSVFYDEPPASLAAALNVFPEDVFLRGSSAATTTVDVAEAPAKPGGITRVTMRRAEVAGTDDQAFWTAIRSSTGAMSFGNYSRFMDIILCGDDPANAAERRRLKIQAVAGQLLSANRRLRLPFPDVDAYRQLKVATEVFMMVNCGVELRAPLFSARGSDFDKQLADENRRFYRELGAREIENVWQSYLQEVGVAQDGVELTLPYLAVIRRKLKDVSVVRKQALYEDDAALACMEILMEKLTKPCFLELIWSYWHEEGMLVQAMNAITWRFQNRRGPADRDPLAVLEIDPLRSLNNFIWGYIQDEQHRLTVPRRAYEYDHHYGLTILGKAAPTVRGADSRTRFLEAFHHLLYVCSIFLKEDDDTTVVADGFPALNALKEVHLLLTQGAHNQYGDLPWTARQEMLMQEWLLARPEFREFLPRRIMVDYPEDWMDSVETMKTLQGWTDASIMHFRDLGVFGEQILLGIRFGAWPSVIESEQAANWVRYWRPEIQGYIHGYRAVTGVDLTDRVDATMPALLLQRRETQRTLPAGGVQRGLPAGADRRGLPAGGEQRGLPAGSPRTIPSKLTT